MVTNSPSNKSQNEKKLSLCRSLLRWIPVLFILSIIGWSYYAFVVRLCLYTIENIPQAISYLVVYHIILGMFLWGYYQTTYTKVGKIPERFKLPKEEWELLTHAENEEMQASILERCSKDLPINNRTLHNSVRYCEKCRLIKPDRAHHCSVCRKCILKMDHHCPWVNNCVGFTNYKFFLLFLAYALIYCIFISLTSLEYFISFWRAHRDGSDDSVSFDKIDKFHIIFLFFVGVMFAISMASLFFYHLYLVSVNRTTLEAFRAPIFPNGPDKNGFNLGRAKNFIEVFGSKPFLWIFPVFSSRGDGISYKRSFLDEEMQSLLNHENID